MRSRSLALVFVLAVATNTIAAEPIPTYLLPETAVAEPTIGFGLAAPYRVAAGAGTFLISSSYAPFKKFSYTNYINVVDQDLHPLLPATILRTDLGPADVAWSGRYYLAVSGAAGAVNGILFDDRGAIVRDRFVIDPPNGQFILDDGNKVAWDGAQFVALHVEYVAGSACGREDHLIATRVAEDGSVLGSVEISSEGPCLSNGGANAVARADGGSLIVWTGPAGTMARTMSTSGVRGPAVMLNAFRASPHEMRLAAGPDGFLLVLWTGTSLVTQPIDRNGNPAGAPVAITTIASFSDLIWSGDSYLLTATRTLNGPPLAIHLDRNGNVIGSDVPLNLSGGVAAWDGSKVIEFGSAKTSDGTVTTMAEMLGSSAAVPVLPVARNQALGAALFQGSQPVVAWNDQSEISTEARVARVGGDSRSIAGPGNVLLGAAPGRDSALYLMRAASTDLIVSASENGSSPLDMTSSSNTHLARAVWTGNDFIVAWARSVGNSFESEIDAARVSKGGIVIDGPYAISGFLDSVNELAIGASTTSTLVVYSNASGLHGILLTPAGEQSTDDLAEPQNLAGRLSVASDGTNFIVTWVSMSSAYYGTRNDYIGARRVDANGHVIDPGGRFIYSPGDDVKPAQSVFWTGSAYLVVWAREVAAGQQPHELQAARIAPDGTLLDYPPVTIGTFTPDPSRPMFGSDPGTISITRDPVRGVLLLVYARTEATGTARLFARVIGFGRQRVVAH